MSGNIFKYCRKRIQKGDFRNSGRGFRFKRRPEVVRGRERELSSSIGEVCPFSSLALQLHSPTKEFENAASS